MGMKLIKNVSPIKAKVNLSVYKPTGELFSFELKAGLDCFDICWDWIDKFKRVYLFMDFDEHGKEATEKILKKFATLFF